MYKIRRKITDIKWWILHRVHPKHRYHVVKLNLEPGYYDPDARILYAVMSIVSDFVKDHGGIEKLEEFTKELEQEEEFIPINQISSQKEVAIIYRWWTEEWKEHWDAEFEDEEALLEKEKEMLIRVMSIRDNLWI